MRAEDGVAGEPVGGALEEHVLGTVTLLPASGRARLAGALAEVEFHPFAALPLLQLRAALLRTGDGSSVDFQQYPTFVCTLHGIFANKMAHSIAIWQLPRHSMCGR